ncbi:hypothetical protein NUW87_06475 [Corynebacterium pilbarense]|uniref:NAD(P)H-flavin reductase n=1 Tax=Corynebacterium pilbarense TaxID=1288393 RepID=A0A9Q4IHF8_9CORY|nr:hypothetical protein [Corynebacterium pilbarense]MCZ2221023.1 hypothetical protein [Corynebacterium pilbarense]
MPSVPFAQTLRTHGPQVSRAWRARFSEAYPQAEMMLPPGDEMPPLLLRAALAVLERPAEEVRDELKALALDLRRTGFPAEEYPNAVQMLIDEGADAEADRTALSDAAELMRDTASQADYAGVPAATAAQVTSVAPHGEVQVVRLEAGTPVPYSPGQVIPVMSPKRPGEWTGLVPALPSNPLGQLEFHIPGNIPLEPGDWLTLGAARGGLREAVDKQLLLVAAEGGFAAAKALVFHCLEQPDPPEVHLVIGAREPGEWYDTTALDALAKAQNWLDITWVAQSRVGASLEQVASGTGMWWGREVIVCAQQERAMSLATALEVAGAQDVQTVVPDAAPEWFSE